MRNMTFWVLMLVLIAGGASAQPSPRVKATRKGATKVTVGKRLDTLKTRVDRLDALGVDIPALLETLRGLQREVSTLKRMMAAKKTVIREYKVLRLQVEALDERLGDLELRLSAVTLCTAAPEEIFSDGLSLRALQGKLELHVRGLLQGEYEGIIATTRRVFSGSSIGEHGS
ncbi:MAG: hypothetical protein KAI47_17770, partial [Deltaproteobacteria bacterium]|nr:hypothetical protein [Deltaproteobacteria bacterium]